MSALAPAAEPATRTLYLIRHGHYAADPAADARLGPGISRFGAAQANLVGARLAGLQVRFDAMHVSPMQRAQDTAAIIAGNFPDSRFDVVDELAECTPPTRDKILMAQANPGDLAACAAQLDRIYARYFKPADAGAQTELLVCHGNVIRSLVVRALGAAADAWLGLSVGHASITKIQIDADGRIKVISVGDVGHLPPNLLTGASGDAEPSLAVPPCPEGRAGAITGSCGPG